MNLFYLDEDIDKCAQAHVDKHVNKMITEACQLLSFAYYPSSDITKCIYDEKGNFKGDEYVECDKTFVAILGNNRQAMKISKSHYNHPCAVWVRQSMYNWLWTLEYARALGREFIVRFNKDPNYVHGALDRFLYIEEGNYPNIPVIRGRTKDKCTTRPQCMPEEYRANTPLEAYRNYYRLGKTDLHKWTGRDKPEWI